MGPSVEDDLEPTSEVCAQCEDELILLEDVFAIQVMQPVLVGGVPQLLPVLDENGDFRYENYFLHFKCWEEIIDELKEEAKDSPPIPDEFAVVTCECCGSGIREYEPSLIVRLGEITRSNRAPSGKNSYAFVECSAPDIYCVYCLMMINDNWLSFWGDGVDVQGECTECKHARCWRGFDCGCTCHDQEGEG